MSEFKTMNICKLCWHDLINPDAIPASATESDPETCAVCGAENTDGIYMRMNEELLDKLKKKLETEITAFNERKE